MNAHLLEKIHNKKAFTILELLITIAIIGVFVAIAIPVFENAMEKSRESVDMENIRTAYVEVSTEILLDEYTTESAKTVKLLQQKNGWNTIAADVYFASLGSVEGKPLKDGVCTVFYSTETNIITFSFDGRIPIESKKGSYLEEIAEGLFVDFVSVIPEEKRAQAKSCLSAGTYVSPLDTSFTINKLELGITPATMDAGCYWNPEKHTWGEVLTEAGIDVAKVSTLGSACYVYFDQDVNPICISYWNEDGKYCYSFLNNGETFKFNSMPGDRALPAYSRDYAKKASIK